MINQKKRVIALGFFDGVHLGHGALLHRVTETAAQIGAAACAFTFDRSPTEFKRSSWPPFLVP